MVLSGQLGLIHNKDRSLTTAFHLTEPKVKQGLSGRDHPASPASPGAIKSEEANGM